MMKEIGIRMSCSIIGRFGSWMYRDKKRNKKQERVRNLQKKEKDMTEIKKRIDELFSKEED